VEQSAREEDPQLDRDEPDYWLLARRPLACLVFLLPLLAIYEAGVLWAGGENPATVRNGADAWMRSLLETAGVPFGFVLPALVVAVLMGWHGESGVRRAGGQASGGEGRRDRSAE
jgi:hypothetical protein